MTATDFILPFQFANLGIRGRLVRLGAVADAVMSAHDYPQPVGEILAQSLALCAALGGSLKYDGVFTLQTKGSGPISLVVADVTSAGEMRGYANFDDARLAEAAGPAEQGLSPVPRLLGTGYLAFTVDQGPDTNRYQGIVELAGPTLAECAHHYLRHSEQIDAGIKVAVWRRAQPDGSACWRSAALMLQHLPPRGDEATRARREAEDVDWRRAVILMSSVTDDELLDWNLRPDDLLFRLFHEEGVNVFRSRPLVHRCRCSEARVRRVLASIPREELDTLKIGGRVEVTCEFCNATYGFDDAALDALASEGAAPVRPS